MSHSLQLHGCSPPDSSVHGISQARILELAAIFYSRGSSWPRDWTRISCASCIVGRFFTAEPIRNSNCLTALCSFLPCNKVNQLYVYSCIAFLLDLPSPHPIIHRAPHPIPAPIPSAPWSHHRRAPSWASALYRAPHCLSVLPTAGDWD